MIPVDYKMDDWEVIRKWFKTLVLCKDHGFVSFVGKMLLFVTDSLACCCYRGIVVSILLAGQQKEDITTLNQLN